MRRIMRVKNVRFNNPPGPPVVDTELGRAMGSIEGWRLFYDPSFIIGDDEAMRNGEDNSRGLPVGGLFGIHSEIVDGNRMLVSGDGTTNLLGVRSPVAFPTHEFSFFTVLRFAPSTTAQQLVRAADTLSGDVLSPYISIHANGSTFSFADKYNSDETTQFRLQADVNLEEGIPTLLMMTFGVERGISAFKNSALVGANADDRRPINASFAPEEWDIYRNCRRHFGMTGLLGIDLSRPEYSAWRQSIERFLMKKYGIPSPQ